MSDKHDIDHPFVRLETPTSTGYVITSLLHARDWILKLHFDASTELKFLKGISKIRLKFKLEAFSLELELFAVMTGTGQIKMV